MKKIFVRILFCFVIVLNLFFTKNAFSDLPRSPSRGKEWIVDDAKVFSNEKYKQLNDTLKSFEKTSGHVFVILTTESIGDRSIEQFGISVAENWKIGRKGHDDGLILILAKKERKIRLEVGYGLEGTLPDIQAGRIIQNYIVPTIKTKTFADGLELGVNTIIEYLNTGKLNGDQIPTKTDNTSESGSENKLKIPVEYHTSAVGVSIVVMLVFGFAVVFQSPAVFTLGGISIAGLGGGLIAVMTDVNHGAIAGVVFFVLFLILRKLFWRQKSERNAADSTEATPDTTTSVYETGHSSERDDNSSSSNSDDSSRGGNFGGGGASGNF